MEYGLIPRINQYAENNQIQIQQIQPSNEIAQLNNGNETKSLKSETYVKDVEEIPSEKTSQVKEVSAQKVAQYQEVELTNLNFGYNESSHDFYVKAVRGESQSQYPTDEMMKLKAYFIAESKAQMEAELNS